METLKIDGNTFQAMTIATPHTRLLVICGAKGLLGCGYLNVNTAEKVQDALAVVTGVASYEEMLAAEVRTVSSAAAALGIAPGMTGKEALAKLA